MTFDPNKLSTSNNRKLNYDYLWATYIPDRRPQFKIHGNRGQAITAVKYRSVYQIGGIHSIDTDIKLYKRETVDSLWVEVKLKEFYDKDESIIADGS